MVRVKKPKSTAIGTDDGSVVYADPKSQYIRSRKHIPLEKLAPQWRHVRGCSIQKLKRRSSEEGWIEERKKYWQDMTKLVAKELDEARVREMKELVLRANKEHFELGGSLISTGYKISKHFWDNKSWQDLAPREMARILPSLYKTGVDLQRKGLGLADKVVRVQHTREITQNVVQILVKYINDSQTFESIIQELEQLVDDEEKTLEEEINATVEEAIKKDGTN